MARFGRSAPVWSFLGSPVLVDALLEAMARGVPWTAKSLGERLRGHCHGNWRAGTAWAKMA